MSETTIADKRLSSFELIKQALRGVEMDYTTGSIRRAVILLMIPMMIEMFMESVFALVDLYFVGHLSYSKQAIQVVGLTESVLTIIYSLAIGMSMAATALVARRIGEKNPEAAAHAGAQVLIVACTVDLVLSVAGFIFAKDILLLMGARDETAALGTPFVRIMMGGSIVIMLLYLINGIFRGAGNASMAMKSLMVGNLSNVVLCPILINGLGPIPAFGLTGAAMATTIGRGVGVVYQTYHLFSGSSTIHLRLRNWILDLPVIKSVVNIAAPAILQFVIASCSWIFLQKLVAETGHDTGSASYQTAIRLMMFFMLPAWGMSNAAATLVGQNLGALNPKRAEDSVMKTMKYVVIFMACVTLITFVFGNLLTAFFTNDTEVQQLATTALRIISLGYIFYGMGMVTMNAFNGAGDTWTPTWVYFFGFWLFQIPFAYVLALSFNLGPFGVFVAVPVAETLMAIATYILFRRGKWKLKKV